MKADTLKMPPDRTMSAELTDVIWAARGIIHPVQEVIPIPETIIQAMQEAIRTNKEDIRTIQEITIPMRDIQAIPDKGVTILLN